MRSKSGQKPNVKEAAASRTVHIMGGRVGGWRGRERAAETAAPLVPTKSSFLAARRFDQRFGYLNIQRRFLPVRPTQSGQALLDTSVIDDVA